jgi:hypothetical protein
MQASQLQAPISAHPRLHPAAASTACAAITPPALPWRASYDDSMEPTSTSRYDKEKGRYQPTARRMTSVQIGAT